MFGLFAISMKTSKQRDEFINTGVYIYIHCAEYLTTTLGISLTSACLTSLMKSKNRDIHILFYTF